MIVYLAAAIDNRKVGVQLGAPTVTDIFQTLGEKLAPATCFNPRGAYVNANKTVEDDRFVATMNFTGIRNADVIVAYVEPGVMSFGMPMELMFAAAIGKPVVLVSDGPLGIYARVFSDVVIKLDQLNLDLVKSVVDGHSQFGSSMAMEADVKKAWIRNLLK